ncbi:MAG: ATP-grasp domain-containing protein [Legionella sp.]|nr:ATP-grasp domain-containing protein [Legionella sp.]
MKILITGAGGAAAISVWKSLGQDHEIFMADIDPCAAGLYLVPPERRLIIPAGNSPRFIQALLNHCEKNQIQALIPTVDVELLPIAESQNLFNAKGIIVPISPAATLDLCRDKYKLLSYCEDTGLTPSFCLMTETTTISTFPCFAKPRLGAGSRGVLTIHNKKELQQLPKDSSYLVQELLPGEEYSVDVYISSKGDALAAVPRLRMKIDSGIAVACQTKIYPELSAMALEIAKKTGILYVANIQFKANADNQFKLLEINPRFPGTLPLTAAAGIDIPKLLIKDISNESPGTDLLTFKELMVVRYWTEEFFPIDEWRALCP